MLQRRSLTSSTLPSEASGAGGQQTGTTPKAATATSIAELRARAEAFILELIRETPAFDFWKTELWESLEISKSGAP